MRDFAIGAAVVAALYVMLVASVVVPAFLRARKLVKENELRGAQIRVNVDAAFRGYK